LSDNHAIKTLCRVLNVNRSTYYKHLNHQPSKRELENQSLRRDILSLYIRYKKRLGSYKIRQRLLVEYGKKVSHGRVYRLMKSMNLPQMSTVKPIIKFKSNDMSFKNHLQKNFNPSRPNKIWVSDITYIRVSSKFFYLCVIMDLYSRKVISYSISGNNNTKLVLDAFYSAYNKNAQPSHVMFHSDRGVQYTSKEFRKVLDNVDFLHSFSAKGHPFDNAVIESFFKYLKKEQLNRTSFSTLRQLKDSLFEYINSFYNKSRPHSANDGLSPIEFEDLFYSNL
jgi:putative transposase